PPARARVPVADRDGGEHATDGHARDISAVSLPVDLPLDWTAFGVWLTMLLHAHGENVLRVKGILRIRGMSIPVVIHGIHHLMHPPTSLPRWPTADRRSHLVLIVRTLTAPAIARSLRAFLRPPVRSRRGTW